MKNATEKNPLPISKKFYVEIGERIHAAIEAVASVNYGVSFYQVMETVEAYLYCGIVPDCGVNPDVRLIFHLLQPEIDKAIRRSSRAREAAARRRELKALAESQSVETGVETSEESTTKADAFTEKPAPLSDLAEKLAAAVEAIEKTDAAFAETGSTVSGRSKRRRRRHGNRGKKR